VVSTWPYSVVSAADRGIMGKTSQPSVEYIMKAYRRDCPDTTRRRVTDSRSACHTSKAISSNHENEDRKLKYVIIAVTLQNIPAENKLSVKLYVEKTVY
jgi:hypothetical protein